MINPELQNYLPLPFAMVLLFMLFQSVLLCVFSSYSSSLSKKKRKRLRVWTKRFSLLLLEFLLLFFESDCFRDVMLSSPSNGATLPVSIENSEDVEVQIIVHK